MLKIRVRLQYQRAGNTVTDVAEVKGIPEAAWR